MLWHEVPESDRYCNKIILACFFKLIFDNWTCSHLTMLTLLIVSYECNCNGHCEIR